MRRAWFVFLFSVILVVSRRPDVLVRAQFWAEDGKFWYADAYNLGAIAPLLHPAAGYFQTLPRIAALLALALPLAAAPLLFNCIGILIQVLPVQFLLSSRCRELGSDAGRCLFAFLYLGLPNSQEIHVNISNEQWRLALLAMLVIFSKPGRTKLWDAFDLGVLALSAMTGPFVIFIVPIAVVYYFIEGRGRRLLALAVTSVIGAAIQVMAVFVAGGSERPVNAVKAATPELLIQILAKQVFFAALVGKRTVGRFSFELGWSWTAAVAVVVVGFAVELYVLWKAPVPWKALILFSACILGVSLAAPTTLSPQWSNLLEAGGIRYWFFPMLAFMASIAWMLHGRNPAPVRVAASLLLVVMMFGIIQDWGHPRPVDLHFADYAKTFSMQPAGTRFVIPLNPVGWTMELTKH